MQTPLPSQGYQLLPIDRVRESAINARQLFNGIDQLAETIREHGVIVPLLVRPNGDAFEVVAGARRLRAARKAGAGEIPAIIRELSDAQLLELSLLENVQRAGIQPLEEARGYRALIERAHLTQEAIAQRIGRSQSHIAQRLALLRLTKPALDALAAGRLSTSQAVMIARLQPADQGRALEFAERWGDGMSTRQLAQWIEREVYIQLRGAPFDIKDQSLVPAAGSCQGCPKRTGCAPDLFSDVRRADTCTDPACYERKIQAHIQAAAKSLEASGKKFLRVSRAWHDRYSNRQRLPGILYEPEYVLIEPEAKACPSALPALVVHGRQDVGHMLTVCADKRCRQHFRAAQSTRDPANLRRRQAEQSRKEVKRRLLAAILEKIRAPLSGPDLRLVLAAWFDMAGQERRLALCQQERIDPVIVAAQGGHKDYAQGFRAYIARLDTPGLHRMLLAMALITHLLWDDSKQSLEKLAVERRIDVEAIRQQVSAELGGQ